MDNETKHIRRARYSGTHPKKFSEKYKELNPDKYADTIEHIRQKGMTPAGMHISIMVDEILQILDIQPGEKGYDATLGYGGHTLAMLKILNHSGHIYATDVDPVESAKTGERLEKAGFGKEDITIELMNFADIDRLADKYGKFDFVLADLGVSSMQIDNPERGFSYKYDGPLDLRLNQSEGITASERIAAATLEELTGMFEENADEPYAYQIAKEIKAAQRKGQKIDTTMKLRAVIEKAISFVPEKDRKEILKKTCARVFQALRIDVNNEFEVLYAFLDKLPHVLNKGARVAILTFHSGEDKLVKKAFKKGLNEGLYSEIAKDVIKPSAKECAQNSRAHSTKLRWAKV